VACKSPRQADELVTRENPKTCAWVILPADDLIRLERQRVRRWERHDRRDAGADKNLENIKYLAMLTRP
jgi:hypothetical protein